MAEETTYQLTEEDLVYDRIVDEFTRNVMLGEEAYAFDPDVTLVSDDDLIHMPCGADVADPIVHRAGCELCPQLPGTIALFREFGSHYAGAGHAGPDSPHRQNTRIHPLCTYA